MLHPLYFEHRVDQARLAQGKRIVSEEVPVVHRYRSWNTSAITLQNVAPTSKRLGLRRPRHDDTSGSRRLWLVHTH
jgi:hypothetical protein